MGILRCIFRLMILFGFGLRLRFIYFARVASFSFVASLLLFSQASQAAYTWGSGATGYIYPDAVSACSAAFSAAGVGSTTDVGATVSVNGAQCTGTAYRNDGTTYAASVLGIGVSRSGTGCDTGSTYNVLTGACDTDSNKCAILKDTPIASFRYASATDTPPNTISVNGCEATTGGITVCHNSTKGNYVCTGTATLTGNLLAPTDVATSGSCSGADCTAGQPVATASSTPCNMVDGACTSTSSKSDPGITSCSGSGTSYTCTENPLSASIDKSNAITEVSDTSTTGTTTSTTTTTTTTDACSGVGSCSTSVTVSKSSTGTNADGTGSGTTTSCSGSDCDGSTPKTDDDDDDDENVSGDMVCTAVVSCGGDAIQCAILRQTQQSRCADVDFRDLSDKKVADAKATLDTEFAAADYQPITADADHTFDVSSMLDTSSFFGSSCPVLPSISGSYGQFAVSIDFNLASFCTFLTILGYINVAFAMKKAAEIIGKGA